MQLFTNITKIEKPFLMDFGVEQSSTNNQIIIPNLQGYDILNCNDIIYLHAEGNYTNIFCIKDKKYCFSKVLKYVASKIDNDNFLKCHRSYIINTTYLKAIKTTKLGYHCIMSGDKVIPVSRNNRTILKDWIKQRI